MIESNSGDNTIHLQQHNHGNDGLPPIGSSPVPSIHDPSLLSKLGVYYGIGMNVNNVLGSGIVTTPGIIWNSVKSPVIVLILWLIGGLVSMAGSLTYVELGAMHKISDREKSLSNWQEPLDGDANIAAYSSSVLLIMFSYDGWNNLNYSLDEFKNPGKQLIKSNSISVGIVTIMYLLVNVAFISVIPKGDVLDNKTTNETIAVSFFNHLFRSDAIVRMFTLLIVLSVIGTAAANVWSGSRVIVAAARSKFFPIYSDQLKNWHDNYNTPINALLAQCIWCSLIILFVGSSFTITSYELFSKFAMYSFWIFYFATGVGLLVLRRQSPQKKRPFRKAENVPENEIIQRKENRRGKQKDRNKNSNGKIPESTSEFYPGTY
ncbi:7255_t:CDS:2 [Funneliformis geosporum]|nr:7255_t:CDS:2 [Funneliformis geosporum]